MVWHSDKRHMRFFTRPWRHRRHSQHSNRSLSPNRHTVAGGGDGGWITARRDRFLGNGLN